ADCVEMNVVFGKIPQTNYGPLHGSSIRLGSEQECGKHRTSDAREKMKRSSTTRKSPNRTKTDWNRLRNLTDREIDRAVRDDPDAAEALDTNFWKKAHLVTPEPKVPVSLRV